MIGSHPGADGALVQPVVFSKRDSAVHDLWEADGTPLGPPWHYMARLQPIISSARALYSLREVRLHGVLVPIAPPPFFLFPGARRVCSRCSVTRGTMVCQELVQLRPGWHPATRYKQETVLNMFDNDGGDGGIFSEEGEGAAKEGEEPRSAFLLEGSLDPKESLRRRAVDHMRMGDPARLPIEEKKLMELLSLWGCFKHVKGTSCECHNPAHRVNPYLMKNPDPKERRKFVGAANLEKEPSGRLRIGDQSVDPGQYVAAEVLEHIASNLRSKR